jgi:sporulation protein YlmC with PRC-barrel domain
VESEKSLFQKEAFVSETQATLRRLGDTDLRLKDNAEDIRGRTVRDKDDNDIGHVDDLLVDDTENKVRFLQVAAGGFLGLGQKKFLVPVDAISRIDDQHVHIDRTLEHVTGAPDYDPEVVAERSYYEGLYGYYGYPAYWSPGYMYPSYPYYESTRQSVEQRP